MKNIGLAIITGLFFNVHAKAADCSLFVASSDFYYAGEAVHFGVALESSLQKKNFTLIEATQPHHYEFNFAATDVELNHFDHAQGEFWIKDLKTGQNLYDDTQIKTCMTTLCGISDFQDSIIKSLKNLDANLNPCAQ